jgi:hypothetical protein
VAVKIFPPKNFGMIIFKSFFSTLFVFLSPNFTADTSGSYQMYLLLLADPETRWIRNAEPWVVGLSSYPLDLNDRIILIMEFPDKL